MTSISAGTEFEPEIRRLGHLQLFLYSASVQIPHRIHYDASYAREEGHGDVVVHGPFQAVCMVQNAMKGLGGDWRVAQVKFRNLSSVLVDVPFVCSSRVVDADGDTARIQIESKSEDGSLTYTTGEIVVERVAQASH